MKKRHLIPIFSTFILLVADLCHASGGQGLEACAMGHLFHLCLYQFFFVVFLFVCNAWLESSLAKSKRTYRTSVAYTRVAMQVAVVILLVFDGFAIKWIYPIDYVLRFLF